MILNPKINYHLWLQYKINYDNQVPGSNGFAKTAALTFDKSVLP